MCIIAIISHKQHLLSEKLIKKCWNSNPDGAGFMYTDQADPSKIVVRKGFMTLPDLLEAWKEYKTHPRTSGYTVIHFRIGTSGGKTADMTHPFITFNDDEDTTQAIAHNGIIDIPHDRLLRSDTAQFAAMISKMAKSVEWVHSEFTRRMVEEFIGKWNKIVVLTGDRLDILNEGSGERDNMGRWWSNAGWRAQESKLKNVCDPRTWKTTDDGDWYRPLPSTVSKVQSLPPAEVVDDLQADDATIVTAEFKPAPKHAGNPPVNRVGELWQWSSEWECWVCTKGERKGAIAMPHNTYFST